MLVGVRKVRQDDTYTLSQAEGWRIESHRAAAVKRQLIESKAEMVAQAVRSD